MFLDDLITKNENEINMMSPISIAYVGDSVFSTYVRTYLANTTNFNQNTMNKLSIKYVKASSQSYIIKELINTGFLNEDEIDIAKRGRNAKSNHIPKSATVSEYSYSTSFETLVGYLYLTKNDERLETVLKESINIINKRS